VTGARLGTMDEGAAMSVVVATDRFDTAARTLECLRLQTIRERLEIVLVSLSGKPLGVPPAALNCFACHVLIEPEARLTLPAGRATGVRAARAPLVCVAETHAFPHPDLAELLIGAAQTQRAAVVPGFCNANPDGAISWSNLIADYGPWLDALPRGRRKLCPPYNTLFRRAFAVEAAEGDESAFAPGYDLVARLHAQGYEIFSEPDARLDHVNVSLRRTWLTQRFIAGRSQAGVRAQRWSRSRRAAYALGSPLLPLVLLARCARPFVAARRAHRIPWLTAPALVAGVLAVAAGELTAFVAGGSPDVLEAADEFELHKVDYTRRDA
jgi:hypothetical protein